MAIPILILAVCILLIGAGFGEPGEGRTRMQVCFLLLGLIGVVLIQWKVMLLALDFIGKKQESIIEEEGIRLPILGFFAFRGDRED